MLDSGFWDFFGNRSRTVVVSVTDALHNTRFCSVGNDGNQTIYNHDLNLTIIYSYNYCNLISTLRAICDFDYTAR